MTNRDLETNIYQEHQRIAKMADKVTIQFEKHNVNVNVVSQWQYIADHVESIECALNDDNCTVINVRFGKGGLMKKHKYDRIEEIFVVAGKIYDTISGITTTQGNTYIVPKDTYHEIKSDFARLTVVFRPPLPKSEIPYY